MLPLVVSPVALVAGVCTVLGWGLDDQGILLFRLDATCRTSRCPLILPLSYVVLALPFVVPRAGRRAARRSTSRRWSRPRAASARSWPVVLWRVVLPNLRTALLSAAVLTLALVFGEYTVASILGFVPFAVWIVQFGQGSGAAADRGVAAQPAARPGSSCC